MNIKLANNYRGQWVGVKFYKAPPNLSHVERLENVRFCEATRVAACRPVLLDERSVSCPGARYIFGWDHDLSGHLMDHCVDKCEIEPYSFTKLISELPRIKHPLNSIGLNTEKNPDVMLSYLLPQDVMKLINTFLG